MADAISTITALGALINKGMGGLDNLSKKASEKSKNLSPELNVEATNIASSTGASAGAGVSLDPLQTSLESIDSHLGELEKQGLGAEKRDQKRAKLEMEAARDSVGAVKVGGGGIGGMGGGTGKAKKKSKGLGGKLMDFGKTAIGGAATAIAGGLGLGAVAGFFSGNEEEPEGMKNLKKYGKADMTDEEKEKWEKDKIKAEKKRVAEDQAARIKAAKEAREKQEKLAKERAAEQEATKAKIADRGKSFTDADKRRAKKAKEPKRVAKFFVGPGGESGKNIHGGERVDMQDRGQSGRGTDAAAHTVSAGGVTRAGDKKAAKREGQSLDQTLMAKERKESGKEDAVSLSVSEMQGSDIWKDILATAKILPFADKDKRKKAIDLAHKKAGRKWVASKLKEMGLPASSDVVMVQDASIIRDEDRDHSADVAASKPPSGADYKQGAVGAVGKDAFRKRDQVEAIKADRKKDVMMTGGEGVDNYTEMTATDSSKSNSAGLEGASDLVQRDESSMVTLSKDKHQVQDEDGNYVAGDGSKEYQVAAMKNTMDEKMLGGSTASSSYFETDKVKTTALERKKAGQQSGQFGYSMFDKKGNESSGVIRSKEDIDDVISAYGEELGNSKELRASLMKMLEAVTPPEWKIHGKPESKVKGVDDPVAKTLSTTRAVEPPKLDGKTNQSGEKLENLGTAAGASTAIPAAPIIINNEVKGGDNISIGAAPSTAHGRNPIATAGYNPANP